MLLRNRFRQPLYVHYKRIEICIAKLKMYHKIQKQYIQVALNSIKNNLQGSSERSKISNKLTDSKVQLP